MENNTLIAHMVITGNFTTMNVFAEYHAHSLNPSGNVWIIMVNEFLYNHSFEKIQIQANICDDQPLKGRSA